MKFFGSKGRVCKSPYLDTGGRDRSPTNHTVRPSDVIGTNKQ